MVIFESKKLEIFKRCSCGRRWVSIDDLVNDPDMYYIGVSLLGTKTLFLFTHRTCKSTLAISTEWMDAYYRHLNEVLEKEAV